MKECPYCGSDEYYTKEHVRGNVNHYVKFDGQPANNMELYDYLNHKVRSKYAWCSDCNKRLFKLSNNK